MNAHQEHHRIRLDHLEGLLRHALATLDATRGRAAVDDRGVGASKMLVSKSLEALDQIRAALLTPFPKTCGCGDSYDEESWRSLEYVGKQEDGDGGEFELRNCAGCCSTLAIQLPRPVATRSTDAQRGALCLDSTERAPLTRIA